MVLLFLFILLFVCSLLEINSNKGPNKHLFNILYILLSFVVIIRYGVGADYAGYYYGFNEVMSLNINNIQDYYTANIHGEPIYTLLVIIFGRLGLSFYELAIFFGAITMILYYYFFNKYCNSSVISLFVFLSVYYIVYPFNVIRQGFTLAAFLGILLPLLIDGKYIKYSILVMLFSLFHYSLLSVLILPLIMKLKWNIYTLFALSLIVLLLPIGDYVVNALIVTDSVSEYANSRAYYFALANRIVFIIPTIYIFTHTRKDSMEYKIALINMIGFALFLGLMNYSLIASRVTLYFKATEIYLISYFLRNVKIKAEKTILFYISTALLLIIYIKTINTDIHYLIYHGNYPIGGSILEYRIQNPYFRP